MGYFDKLLFEPGLLTPGQRPAGEVAIDWSNPIAQGLVGCFLFLIDGPIVLNVVTQKYCTINGTWGGGWNYWTPDGVHLENAYIVTDLSVDNVFPQGSFFLFGSPSTDVATIVGNSGTDVNFTMKFGAATQVMMGVDGTWGYHSVFSGLGGGGFRAHYARWDDVSNVYTVGVDNIRDAGTGVAQPAGSPTITLCGGPVGRFDGSLPAIASVAYLWNREISDREFDLLMEDRYQLITTPMRLIVPAAGGVASVSPNGLSQAQLLEGVVLTQHSVLAPNSLAQAQGINVAALTQHGSITVSELLQSQLLSSSPLTQHHALTPAAMAQAQALGSALLTVAGVLSVSGLIQGQLVDVVALTQHHSIIPAGLLQGQSLDATTLAIGGVSLVVASLSQAQRMDAAALTQHNVLVVNDLVQQQILEQANFGLAVGWLQGTVVIVSMLDGAVTISPALDGTTNLDPSLNGSISIN